MHINDGQGLFSWEAEEYSRWSFFNKQSIPQYFSMPGINYDDLSHFAKFFKQAKDIPNELDFDNLEIKTFFDENKDHKIPKNYDLRKMFPACKHVKKIYDQGTCGCSWAISTASAISDRICVASSLAGSMNDKQVSSAELMTCCHDCKYNDNGCIGGIPKKAYQYWVDFGLPTGGEFGDKDVCKPFPYLSCFSKKTDGNFLNL